MRNFIKSLQNRLVNVNKNNKSILHLRIQKNNEIDLENFLFAGFIKNPHDILTQLFDARKIIPLIQDIDARDEAANFLSNRLKKIEFTSKTVFEEKGSLELFVGWPYCQGVLQDGVLVRCPLLFLPVKLYKENSIWKITQNKEIPISLNRSFLIAYAHYNSISLTQEFIETDFSSYSADLGEFKNQFYEFLKASPLDVNFNRDLFTDTLVKFHDIKKEALEQEVKYGQLKLLHTAVLGVFPQYSSYLFPDYDRFLEKFQFEYTEDFLQTKFLPQLTDSAFQENKNYLPFSIDGTQELAFDKIKKGSSLVIQGPPGSGKSQLICNLISDFVARGKKVLVISQKKVALEVVRNRISESGMSDFCSLVHDVKADRTSVFQQISDQISKITEFEISNNKLDSIVLEREFLQLSKQIEINKQTLSEYKNVLFDDSRFGISPKELYLNLKYEKEIYTSEFAGKFTFDEVNDFLNEISSRFSWLIKYEADKNFLLKNRLNFHLLELSDKRKYIETFEDLVFSKKELLNSLHDFSIVEIELKTIETHVHIHEKIKTFLLALKNPLLLYLFSFFNFRSSKEIKSLRQLNKKIEALFKSSKNRFEEFLNEKERLKLFEDLQEWQEVKSSFFKRQLWFLSRNQSILKKVLKENQLEWSVENIDIIFNQIVKRNSFDVLILELRGLGFNFPTTSCQQFHELWKENWALVDEVFHFFESETIYSTFIKKNISQIEFLERELIKQQNDFLKFKQKCAYAQLILSEEQVLFAVNVCINHDLDTFKEVVENSFEELVEWDKYWFAIPNFVKNFVRELFENYSFSTYEDFKQKFFQVLYGNWINILESDNPILTLVSSSRLDVVISDFQQAISRKKELAKDIALLRMKERTYANLEFNRLNNRVTYRELEHQVTKKKRLWPLNKLMEQHSSEIFDLVPCWLCSPESASAIFPVEDLFDLVIFDEASQCYLERGFPGLLRGKQIVICGDSKQLQPTDLYAIRWDEEDEYENLDLELDSLLAFGEKYFESIMLQGHYRSKSADLIAFSNQYFYKSKLLCIPDQKFIQHATSVLEYKKVPGYWDKNINSVEAKEVLALILQQDFNAKKIGVISFNYKQQELIHELLSDYFLKNDMMFPNSIFVKNIENVQGDEADIIIFSIGYAPTLSGKFNMNFGLLNQEGGENRLNVAISRAREKIIVVTSIFPNQLDVETSIHEGPKYLKKYLEFVYEYSKIKRFQILSGKQDSLDRMEYLKNNISDILNQENIRTKNDLHFCDVAIVNQSQALEKVILTDDQLVFEDNSIKSVFAYLPEQLKVKGWDSKRFYSRNFWKDKNAFHKAVLDFVKR